MGPLVPIPPCPVCRGNKVVTAVVQGKAKQLPCPACKGSGQGAYGTKG